MINKVSEEKSEDNIYKNVKYIFMGHNVFLISYYTSALW